MSYFKLYIFFLLVYFFTFFSSYAVMQNDMVLITPGFYSPLFKYGNSVNEKVYVKAFMINRYPVTNFEFEQFVLKNPKWSFENVDLIFADKNYLNSWKNCDITSIYDYPVVYVSWFAADAYCSYFGNRLPNIDEWEYVSSAGLDHINGRAEDDYLQIILDWYIVSQVKGLVDIYSMQKNYWGVFGLHGSVWEWVNDFNSVILLNTDAEGGGLEEVLYCGATATNAIDPADYVAFMRFAFRNTLEADYTSSSLGFRCVRDVD